MTDLLTVMPSKGLGDISFGYSFKRVRSLLGNPEKVTIDKSKEYTSIAWYYWSSYISLNFYKEEKFLLSTIESSNPKLVFMDDCIIGNKREKVYEILKDRGIKFEDNKDNIHIPELNLNLWIESKTVSGVQLWPNQSLEVTVLADARPAPQL